MLTLYRKARMFTHVCWIDFKVTSVWMVFYLANLRQFYPSVCPSVTLVYGWCWNGYTYH